MARALAPRLAEVEFAHVLSSPRRRARQTCSLAGLEALTQIDQDLAEWDYGQYEGLRSSEILLERPDWDIWQDGCPGGESPATISARADRVVGMVSKMQGDVAIFSHGHFGRVFAARWLGQPLAMGQSLLLDPATLSILDIDQRHAMTPVIRCWNAP